MNFVNLNDFKEDTSKSNELIRTFHSLPIGDKFVLESNEELDQILYKLEEKYKNVVEWEYVKEGPEEWQAVISKKAYNFI